MNASLINKSIRVIRSCTTRVQLKTAIRFAQLAYRQSPDDVFKRVMISEIRVACPGINTEGLF